VRKPPRSGMMFGNRLIRKPGVYTSYGNEFGGAGVSSGPAINDERPYVPEISIEAVDADKPEGNSGPTAYTFLVTRRLGKTGIVSTVDYAVDNTAEAGDFVDGVLPSGTLTFAETETSKLLTIYAQGDTDVENDEGFTVTLSNPVNAVLGVATATGSIQNDDNAEVGVEWLILEGGSYNWRKGRFGGNDWIEYQQFPLHGGYPAFRPTMQAWYLTQLPIINDQAGNLVVFGNGNNSYYGYYPGYGYSLDDGSNWDVGPNISPYYPTVRWDNNGVSAEYAFGRYYFGFSSVQFLTYTTDLANPAAFVSVTLPANAYSQFILRYRSGYLYVACQPNTAGHTGTLVLRSSTGNSGSWSQVKASNQDSSTNGTTIQPIALISATANLVLFDWAGRVSTSSDGSTWTAYSSTGITSYLLTRGGIDAASNSIMAVAYGNGLYVAIGVSTGDSVFTAGEDLVFTRQSLNITTPGFGSWNYVAFGDGKFVIVGDSGECYYSTDGYAWTKQNLGFPSDAFLLGAIPLQS
jgi:hypothetical protein